jgi:alkylation response protein AidB-like acyl-CoA dehydrogenase
MDLSPDPVLDRIGTAVRTRLSTVDATSAGDVLAALRDGEALAFEAPEDIGGYDLGLTCGVVINRELGRLAAPDVYTGGALVVDAAPGCPTAKSVLAGEVSVVATGLDRLAGPALTTTDLSGPEPSTTDTSAPRCFPVRDDDRVRLTLRTCQSAAGETVIGDLGTGTPLSDPDGILAKARVRHAAYLLGLGEGAHQLAVGYAARRRQFGSSILDNQAIAFPLAQQKIALAAVQLKVRKAAWLADTGAPFAGHATEAIAYAAEVTLAVVRTAVQVHGARGMSLSTPVHACYLAARDAVTRFGPPSPLWIEAGRRRLAAASPLRERRQPCG